MVDPCDNRVPVYIAVLEGCPSGQRDQTVNLTAYAFEGSNPSPSTIYVVRFAGRGCSSTVELQPSKLMVWVRFPSPAPRYVHLGPHSSAVEHFLGKEEVTGSIPVVGSSDMRF